MRSWECQQPILWVSCSTLITTLHLQTDKIHCCLSCLGGIPVEEQEAHRGRDEGEHEVCREEVSVANCKREGKAAQERTLQCEVGEEAAIWEGCRNNDWPLHLSKRSLMSPGWPTKQRPWHIQYRSPP